MATTNVTMRIDAELKRRAEEMFDDFGMSMTTAYVMFLKQAIREQRIPFAVSRNVPNAEMIEAINEGRKLMGDPGARRFTSMEELIKDLNDED